MEIVQEGEEDVDLGGAEEGEAVEAGAGVREVLGRLHQGKPSSLMSAR